MTNHEMTERSLKYLESEGYEVKALWQELSRQIKDVGVPHPDDLLYLLPDAPLTVLKDHFPNGRLPEKLSASNARKGFSYTLTPGQRTWIRTHYALTPAQTVTITELCNWDGTLHPKSIRIESDIHIDPRLRRHTLIVANISQPGTFFRESALEDQRMAELEPREGQITQLIDENYCEVKCTNMLFEARFKGLRLAVNDFVTIHWDDDEWQVTKRISERALETRTATKRTKKTFEEMYAELEETLGTALESPFNDL